MIMLDKCGMSRTQEGLDEAIRAIRALREQFWNEVRVPGDGGDLNQELEKAGRVADYFELAELMCLDASAREESCGGHFREEYQTEEGEALRDDEISATSRCGSTRGGSEPTGATHRAARVRERRAGDEELQMRLTLHIWRQNGPADPGGFATYELEDVNTHMSFLEMLDVLNQELIARGEEPVAFEHDCREGICGCCGFVINGVAHGGQTRQHGVPAPHAPLLRRRRALHRAVAGEGAFR